MLTIPFPNNPFPEMPPIAYHKFKDKAEYAQDRTAFVQSVEAFRSTPYNAQDTGVTIGYGCNLTVHPELLSQVFSFIGLKTTSDWSIISALTGAIESPQIVYRSDKDGKQAVDAAMSTILIQRQFSTILSKRGLRFAITQAQALELYNIQIESFEKALDKEIPGVPLSKERVALVSLAYNGIAANAVTLRQSLATGDRAEAWWAIRFNYNRNKISGLYTRRARESDEFSLTDPGPITEDEAITVGDMLTEHGRHLHYDYSELPGIGGNGKPADRAWRLKDYQNAIKPVKEYFQAKYGGGKAFDVMLVVVDKFLFNYGMGSGLMDQDLVAPKGSLLMYFTWKPTDSLGMDLPNRDQTLVLRKGKAFNVSMSGGHITIDTDVETNIGWDSNANIAQDTLIVGGKNVSGDIPSADYTLTLGTGDANDPKQPSLEYVEHTNASGMPPFPRLVEIKYRANAESDPKAIHLYNFQNGCFGISFPPDAPAQN